MTDQQRPFIAIVLDEQEMPQVESNIPAEGMIGILELTKTLMSLQVIQNANQRRAEEAVKNPSSQIVTAKVVPPNNLHKR